MTTEELLEALLRLANYSLAPIGFSWHDLTEEEQALVTPRELAVIQMHCEAQTSIS